MLATTAISASLLFACGGQAQQVLTASDQNSLATAINTANGQTGDTIRLLNSISLTGLLPTVTAPIIFDPNGYTLSGAGGGALLYVSPTTPPVSLGVMSGVLTNSNGNALTLAADGAVTTRATLAGGGAGNAIYGAGNATLVNSGSLSSSAGSGYDAVYVTGGGSLANTGVIAGDGAAVQFNGAATVTNGALGTITGASGSAVYIRGAGAVTNEGALVSTNSEAVAVLQGGSIANTGYVSGSFGGVQLGSASAPNGGGLTNSGQILAAVSGGNGVTIIGAGGVVTNNAGGVIAAPQTVGSGSWGVDFEGAAASLTNAGSILGDVGLVFDGAGTLVNAASGLISGATTGVSTGAGGASGALSLTSAGQIIGGAYAIQLGGSFDNVITLQAGSQTTGLVSIAGGRNTVTLAGLSSGGVNLGSGVNTLILVGGGSAGGTLDGGTGGANSLVLTGTAAGVISAAQLVDFATVTKTGAGTWYVNGASALAAPWSIQQGVVQINAVAGLGAGPVTDNAVLSLYGASGVFANAVSGAGSISVTGVGAGQILTFSGPLTNTGASSIASLIVFDGSSVSVAGTNTSGNIGVALQGQGGTLSIQSGASVTSAGFAVYGAAAGVSVNNAGALIGHTLNGAYGAAVSLYAGGTLNNTGTVTGDGEGVELGQTGAVTNAAGATIAGLNGNAIFALQNAAIINNGTLTSGAGTGYNAVYIAGGGSVSNAGLIAGDGAGVQFNGSATVSNAAGGTISGVSGSAVFIRGAGVLTNGGALSSSGSEAVAILQGGTVTNTGSVTGLYVGVQLGSGAHPAGGSIVNSGAIQATVDGGAAVYTAGAAAVLNAAGATIAASATAGSGSFGVQSDLGVLTLANSGRITGDVGVVLDAGGAVTNAQGGMITGATTGINSGAGGASGAVSIVNAGVISGGRYAVQLTGAFDNVIALNAGSVTTGLISTDAGADALTLAGVSTGGVNLGAGNNTLTVMAGASVQGLLDGGSGGANALILTGSGSGAVAGAQLTDFATVTKTGFGAFTVTGGTSGLTATWTLQQGVLSIASDAALGSGALTIDGGAALQVTATTGGARALALGGPGADIEVAAGATYTLTGPVSGAAASSLNINALGGSGVLAFSANNTATLASALNLYGGAVFAGASGALGVGALNVYDPTLILGGGVALANPITLNAALTVEQDGGTGVLSGVISESAAGSGVIKAGAGTLALAGVNTYTGTTFISGGVLALTGAGSIAASGAVVDNGALDISGASHGAAIKSLSGGGAVLLGAETLTLTNASGVFSGVISGSGGVTFAGGLETLTGVNTYSGATTIAGGSLVLNGSLPNSLVSVTGGGSLQGAGGVSNLMVAAGGILSPGGPSAFGQIAPTGALTLTSGSVYQVNVNAAGQSDVLSVSGKATVSGSRVEVVAGAGAYARNTSYQLLTALGGVSGTFAAVATNLAFLTPNLTYAANAVDLTLTNNTITFQSLAATANQRAAAAALYASSPSSALYAAVSVQTTAGAQAAFEALSGQIYATAPAVQFQETRYVRDAVLDRLRQAGDPTGAAPGLQSGEMASGALGLTAWAHVIGAWSRGSAQAGGDVAASQADAGGAVIGLDGRLGAWRVGLAAAQMKTNLEVAELGSHDSGESTHASVYAGGPVAGGLQARVGFDYGWNDMYSGRTVVFPGFLEEVGAHANTRTEDAFAELGYGLRLGGVSVQPYASLAYVRVSSEDLNEAGGVSALHVGANTLDGVISNVGIRSAMRFTLSPGVNLEPYALAAWGHVYGGAQTSASLTFQSTSTGFMIRGAAMDHDTGEVEAGLAVGTPLGARLTAGYVGQISSSWQDHQARLGLLWAF